MPGAAVLNHHLPYSKASYYPSYWERTTGINELEELNLTGHRENTLFSFLISHIYVQPK